MILGSAVVVPIAVVVVIVVVVVIAVVGFVDISAAAPRSHKTNKRRGIVLLLTDKNSRSCYVLSQNIDCGEVPGNSRVTHGAVLLSFWPTKHNSKEICCKSMKCVKMLSSGASLVVVWRQQKKT